MGAVGFGIWNYSRPPQAQEAAKISVPINVDTPTGAPVGRIEHLTCKVSQGWPVVLVRDANDDSPWWVQGRAERQEAQKYSARAHFGNESTQPGQRYQIVVLSAADESAARQYETGTTLEQIPAGLPHSDPIEVVRR